MRRVTIGAVLVLGAAVSNVGAQDTKTAKPPTDVRQSVENVTTILNLPKRTDEARKAGVPNNEIQTVLDIFKEKKVPPAEQEEILTAHKEATERHGPVDNFGAFVQSQLDQGKRGRDLAAAIHAEHAKRGKGHAKGQEKAMGKDDMKAKGKPEAGEEKEKGKPEEMKGGKPEEKGAKPDQAKGGKPKVKN